MVFKFHDDPTVSEPGIVVLQGPIWVYAGKKEIFRGRRRENEFERKRESLRRTTTTLHLKNT